MGKIHVWMEKEGLGKVCPEVPKKVVYTHNFIRLELDTLDELGQAWEQEGKPNIEDFLSERDIRYEQMPEYSDSEDLPNIPVFDREFHEFGQLSDFDLDDNWVVHWHDGSNWEYAHIPEDAFLMELVPIGESLCIDEHENYTTGGVGRRAYIQRTQCSKWMVYHLTCWQEEWDEVAVFDTWRDFRDYLDSINRGQYAELLPDADQEKGEKET